jgi:hypothetical protein
VNALFLSGHSQNATHARGHEVRGPRGVWAVTNHMNLVGFSARRLPAMNTPKIDEPILVGRLNRRITFEPKMVMKETESCLLQNLKSQLWAY